MVDQLVDYFYTRFLFKIDVLTQEKLFLLDISATFFKKLNPGVIKFLIS